MVPKKPKTPLGDLDIYYNSSSFLGSYEKMADIDIDPFGENIPIIPGTMGGGSTWEPE